MALGRSIKMYLTIFVATTCMYMVLYQYHISRQPMPQPDIIKHRNKSIVKENSNGIGGSYTSYSLSSNNITNSSATALTSSISVSPLISSLQINNSNAVKLQASNKTLLSSPSSPSSISAFTLLSLPSHTKKMFMKINLFLRSPLSLLSSSSSSSSSLSTTFKRAISNKSSLAFKKEKENISTISSSLLSSPLSPSSYISRVMDLNNTLITSSTPSSNTTTTTTLTISPSTVASSSTRFTTVKSSLKFSRKTKQINKLNSDRISLLQQQEQQIEIHKPPLYIITPTYRRPEQLAELTRLGYTLKHVTNLLWLVIEDANNTSQNVIQILNRIGVPYEYFLAPMPNEYKKMKGSKPRGVSNRNRGLKWLRENATEGVFYFADDDNTYDINIFEQMRYTKKVSMWPVGLVTKFGVSSPIVKAGKLSGFYDGWHGGRKYPIDMAGFAVNVKFLHDRPNAKMPFKTGYEEDGFLKSLAPLNNSEIELLANNCTEILTWHTQTKKNNPAEAINVTKYGDTNLILLDKMLVRH